MLDATEQETLRDLIDAFPNQPRQVISELKQQTGKTVSIPPVPPRYEAYIQMGPGLDAGGPQVVPLPTTRPSG